jgi:hypothetical protein
LTGIKVSRTINILHILFVDDVIIMTNATMQEWWEIDKVIKSFCLASGLQVNGTKTTILQEGMTEQELMPFKSMFPYIFSDLESGFKYLGYFLKTGPQRVEDWGWLLKKMEKKIDNWCYRWLSLGGRFTLLKSVLECQPVYWMSLVVVPCSVLNTMRKMMFNFLWRRNSESNQLHLCKWEQITIPKKFGGWGIRNIFDFSKALVANTLWRVLMSGGIWHRVIMDKYLPHTTVKNWFRSQTFQQKASSRIWSGLLKSVHLITHWLSWNPGSGQLIALGKDRILGMGENSFLSINLMSALNHRNILTLAQARRHSDSQHLSSYWLSSSDLGFSGDIAAEWDQFRWALIDSGAFLQDTEDDLMWIGGDNSRSPTVKNIYWAIISTKNLRKVGTWRQSIWKWKIQLKIKLFIWLAAKGKILTWDTLQTRGWEGPGRCYLCKQET